MRRERAAAVAFALIVGYGTIALPVSIIAAAFFVGRWTA